MLSHLHFMCCMKGPLFGRTHWRSNFKHHGLLGDPISSAKHFLSTRLEALKSLIFPLFLLLSCKILSITKNAQ